MCVCLYVWRRPVFTWLPFPLYVCLMAYECFHGNNDSLSWLDGPTYGHAAEGKESSGDHIWLWGDFLFHICTAGRVCGVKQLLSSR